MAEVTLHGVEDIRRRLKLLPKEVQKGGNSPIRFGLRKAAVIVAKRVEELAPGSLGEDIAVRLLAKSKTPENTIIFEVKPIKRPHVALWVEYGTGSFAGKPNIRPKKAKVLYDKETGRFYGTEAQGQRPRPFMRPALEQMFRKAVSEFETQSAKKMERLEKKLSKM